MSETEQADGSGLRVQMSEAASATPTEQIVKAANQAEVLTLTDGRRVTMRKPGVLAQYKLTEALGPELAMNQAYVQQVQPIMWVGAIEDAHGPEALFVPANKLQIESLIERLGEVGMDAILIWYFVNVVGPMDIALRDAKEAADRAAAKN